MPNAAAHKATASSSTNNAGSRRRARRTQNWVSEVPPLFSRSSINKVVIKKPDTTKNTSTPKNPPRIQWNPPW